MSGGVAVVPVEQRAPWRPINVARNQMIGVFGRKGTGKSTLANMLYRQWPGVDKLCIDVSGDDSPGPASTRVTTAPTRMPDPGRDGAGVDLHYVADPGSNTYRDDLDRAIGAGLFPRDRAALVLIHEVGEVLPAGQSGPNGRILVQQGRHYSCSAILCGPRPQKIDPLALSQCDELFLYDVPNPDDRRRLADAMGLEPRELDEAFRGVRARGRHWFLRYGAADHDLTLCPPLPEQWRKTPEIPDDD